VARFERMHERFDRTLIAEEAEALAVILAAPR
jgi:hypothetical protein